MMGNLTKEDYRKSRVSTHRDVIQESIAEEEEQKDNEKQPENADPDDMDSLAMISENS